MSRTPVDPPAIVRPADELVQLAAAINAEHEAGEKSAWKRLQHYRKAGERLLRAKEVAGRGKWLNWFPKNVKFSLRTAHKYMALAKFAATANLEEEEENWNQACSVQEEDEEDEEDIPPEADNRGKFITLDEWNELSDEQKHLTCHLEPFGGDTFNNQGDNENIEWALWSWNPVTGCLHNCPYCYARDIAGRFYAQGFAPSLWVSRLYAPLNTPFPAVKASEWVGHKNVFTCSMADLFGRWVPAEWIEAVLKATGDAPQWNFLFLTKFPQRMAEFDFPENAWVGTTVDCQARVANAERAFRKIKAGVKWLSIEPMIEPLKFDDLAAFHWIVLGGSSESSQTPECARPASGYSPSSSRLPRRAFASMRNRTCGNGFVSTRLSTLNPSRGKLLNRCDTCRWRERRQAWPPSLIRPIAPTASTFGTPAFGQCGRWCSPERAASASAAGCGRRPSRITCATRSGARSTCRKT